MVAARKPGRARRRTRANRQPAGPSEWPRLQGSRRARAGDGRGGHRLEPALRTGPRRAGQDRRGAVPANGRGAPVLQRGAAVRALDRPHADGRALPGFHALLAPMPETGLRAGRGRRAAPSAAGRLARKRRAGRLAAPPDRAGLGLRPARRLAAGRGGRPFAARTACEAACLRLCGRTRVPGRAGHGDALAASAFRRGRAPAGGRGGRPGRTRQRRPCLPAPGRLARVQLPPAVPQSRHGLGQSPARFRPHALARRPRGLCGPGGAAGRATRWSMPACASFGRPAGCTTGCGWSLRPS